MSNNNENKVFYHSLGVEDMLKSLNTTTEGLSDKEALDRLNKYGANELKKAPKKSIFEMLKEQLSDVMVLILIARCV